MAQTVGEAIYKISYDANTGELDAALSKTESKVKKSSESVKANQKKAQDTLVKGAAVAGAALTVFGKTSFDVGKEFDSSMSQVVATLGYTKDELNTTGSEANNTYNTLRNFAKEMGSTTVFSARQAAEALNYMALAGYDADTSMEMLPKVLNLAAAGNMDLARASDMVTDSQTALGLSLDDTTVLVDQMARTASKSNTSVEQLGDAILTIGGTAKLMSGGTQELNTVLGILADNGIKGTEAGTHLRNALLRLAEPTKNGQKLLKELGVEIFDSDGKMRKFSEIFPDLSKAMADFTDEQKINAFSELFNVRDISTANALLDTSKERWAELGAQIEDSAGAAEQMAQVQLDNVGGDVTLMQSAFEGLQIAITEKLAPVLRPVIEGLTGFITFLSQNTWIIGAITAGIATLLGFGIAGKIASVASLLGMASPHLLIIVGIATAIGAIAGFVIEHWEDVANFFGQLGEIIGGIFNGIGEVIGKVFEFIGGLINGYIEWWKSSFKAIGDFIGGVWSGLLDGAKAVWEGIKNIFGGLASFFGSIFSGAWNAVKKVFSTGGKIFMGIVDGIVGAFKNIVNTIIRGINFVVAIPFNAINSALNTLRGINILGVTPFGWLPKIGVPQIPTLATGGIVESARGGSVIVAGEGGEDEWVVPESKMASLIDKINERGAGGGNITVNVYGTFATSTNEQRKVAEVIAQRIQEIQKSRLNEGSVI